MKDEKLEQLAQQVLERAEELGVDSASVSWWFENKQQERSYFHAPDVEESTELDLAVASDSGKWEDCIVVHADLTEAELEKTAKTVSKGMEQ